jgi:hypothetical protein
VLVVSRLGADAKDCWIACAAARDEAAAKARWIGTVEATDADATIKPAIKEFEIKDESRKKRLIAVRRA